MSTPMERPQYWNTVPQVDRVFLCCFFKYVYKGRISLMKKVGESAIKELRRTMVKKWAFGGDFSFVTCKNMM